MVLKLKRGIRNKKGEYKLFFAICNKGIRNAKYYAAESKKKGTPTKYTKTSKSKLTRCPAKYSLESKTQALIYYYR